MELVVFCGLQASGKTSLYLSRFFRTHIHISLDVLRTRQREAALLDLCLRMQQRCVVDNTNPAAADRARYIAPAQEHRFRIVGYYFESRLADCLARNNLRPGKQCIPEAGLRATRSRLELPRAEEGFDELFFVKLTPGGEMDIQPWNP